MVALVRPLAKDGALTHADMAPVVADLFFGGLPGVQLASLRRPAHPPGAGRR